MKLHQRPVSLLDKFSVMGVKSVYILNKAGGLMFQRDFSSELSKLDSNDYLVLASTLHSVHALSAKISPVAGSSGFTQIESDKFVLHCLQSQTGVKFIVITDRRQDNIGAITSKIHLLYADYALKNPFYSLDMPIRCAKFDSNLDLFIGTVN